MTITITITIWVQELHDVDDEPEAPETRRSVLTLARRDYIRYMTTIWVQEPLHPYGYAPIWLWLWSYLMTTSYLIKYDDGIGGGESLAWEPHQIWMRRRRYEQ
jgi:hypothetical protein